MTLACLDPHRGRRGAAGRANSKKDLLTGADPTFLCPTRRVERRWEFYNTWTYRSIEPMDRVDFVQGFADAEGNTVTPVEFGLPPGIPDEVRHVVTFSAIDEGTTQLTFREFGYPDAQTVEISRAGMEQSLEKMATSLASASGEQAR